MHRRSRRFGYLEPGTEPELLKAVPRRRRLRVERRLTRYTVIWLPEPAAPPLFMPTHEDWHLLHPDVGEALQRGLEQAARGEVSYLASHARHLEQQARDELIPDSQ